MTIRSGRPLANAVRMNGLRKTSSMLPRVIRAMMHNGGRQSAITGSTRCRMDPGSQPATGSQCK